MKVRILTYLILILSFWACNQKDSKIKIGNYSVGQKIDSNWNIIAEDSESNFKSLVFNNDSDFCCVAIADTIVSLTKTFENKNLALEFREKVNKALGSKYDSVYSPNTAGIFEAYFYKWYDLKNKDQILMSKTRNRFGNADFKWSIEITNDSLGDQLEKRHDPFYSLASNAPFGQDFKEYLWFASYDSINNVEFLQKGNFIDRISHNQESVILALNYRKAKCKIEFKKIESDTIYVKILDDNFLTEQMGSTGAECFLGETVYTLTENDLVNYVNIEMDYGSHASPGVYCRIDYWELENHAKIKILGAWGDDEIGNAQFAFYSDSMYYPDPNLWYKYDLKADTLIITKEDNYKEKIIINKISSVSMTLYYLDYGISETYRKR
jgi:hypothetical protein